MNKEGTDKAIISDLSGVVPTEGGRDEVPTSKSRKPVPRYLRPPAASCHDLCKYGKRNDVDNVVKNNAIQNKVLDQADIRTSLRGKKRPVVKPRVISSSPRNERCYACVDDKKVLFESVAKTIELLPPPVAEKTFEISTKPEGFCEEPVSMELSPPSSRNKSTSSLDILLGDGKTRSSEEVLGMKGNIESSQTSTLEEQELMKERITSISPKLSISEMDENGKSMAQIFDSAKPETSHDGDVNKNEAKTSMAHNSIKKKIKSSSSWEKNKNSLSSSKKSVTSFRPKFVKEQSRPVFKETISQGTLKIPESSAYLMRRRPSVESSSPSACIIRGIKFSDTGNTGIFRKKTVRPPKVSSSPKIPASNVAALKLWKQKSLEQTPKRMKDHKSIVSSRTLPDSRSFSSGPVVRTTKQDADTESSYTEVNDVMSEHEEIHANPDATGALEGMKKVKVLIKDGGRPGEVLSSAPPRKLKFRRGKVVDLQAENLTPRRLRFRQARMLVEGQSGNRLSKGLRRRRDSIGEESKVPNLPESPSVVLRHQDQLQGKKDLQGNLFNDVIEETANKLVESKKSKVKALVGAFETVISLQENKPASSSS